MTKQQYKDNNYMKNYWLRYVTQRDKESLTKIIPLREIPFWKVKLRENYGNVNNHKLRNIHDW